MYAVFGFLVPFLFSSGANERMRWNTRRWGSQTSRTYHIWMANYSHGTRCHFYVYALRVSHLVKINIYYINVCILCAMFCVNMCSIRKTPKKIVHNFLFVIVLLCVEQTHKISLLVHRILLYYAFIFETGHIFTRSRTIYRIHAFAKPQPSTLPLHVYVYVYVCMLLIFHNFVWCTAEKKMLCTLCDWHVHVRAVFLFFSGFFIVVVVVVFNFQMLHHKVFRVRCFHFHFISTLWKSESYKLRPHLIIIYLSNIPWI